MTPIQFTQSIERALAAPIYRQPIMRAAALQLGVQLAHQRDLLLAKLERQYNSLQAICPDHRQCQTPHDQTFHHHERKFLETLREYETACDALAAGARRLLK